MCYIETHHHFSMFYKVKYIGQFIANHIMTASIIITVFSGIFISHGHAFGDVGDTHQDPPNITSELVLDSISRLERAERVARFGHWEFNLDTNTVLASEGAQILYGLEGDFWNIPEVQKIPLPEYREMLDQALHSLIHNNIPYEVSFKIKRPTDGHILAIYSVAEYIPEQNIVFGVIEDITAQVAAEDAYQNRYNRYLLALTLAITGLLIIIGLLAGAYINHRRLTLTIQEREHTLSTTLNSIGDAVICTDTHGMVTKLNPVAEQLSGWNHEEAIGKPLNEILRLVNDETREPVMNPVDEVLKSGNIVGLANSTVLIAKDGTEYQISDSAAPIRTDAGNNLGVVMVFRDVTEQYESQKELRSWHDLMQYLIKYDPNGIVVLDNNLTHIFVSDRFLSDYNVQDKELIGKNHYEVFPDIPERWREVHNRVLKGEVISSDDDIYYRSDGSIDYTRWECRPWQNNSGEIIGIILYTEVITQKREEEIKKHQTFALLDELMKNSPSLISVLDAEGKYILVSQAHATYLNTSVDEIQGKTVTDLLPSDIAKMFQNDIKKVLKTNEPISKIDILPTENSKIYFETSLFPIEYPGNPANNKLVGAISTDISERVEAERTKLERERYFRTFVEGCPDGIFVQTNHKFAYLNKAALMIFGATAESQVLGTKILDRIHPDYHEIVTRRMQHLNNDIKNVEVIQEIFIRIDGSQVPVEVSAVPILFEGKNGAMVYVRDITERKRAEEDRLNLERHMLQTQKLESLGVLAGGIAHDFNNILMAIMGHSELALEELSPVAPARQSINDIATAAKRASELCRQMMTYAGKTSHTPEQVNLKTLFDEMLHLLKTSISKKAIINLHISENLPPILADPSQIRQIVMNLIINASDAIGDKSGVISITTGATRCDEEYLMQTDLYSEITPGMYVYFEVSDTGSGMDTETQSRIFEPFFTTKFSGRGLGLASVMGIVRTHNGAIKVYSEPGKGTTFKILLPAVNNVLSISDAKNNKSQGKLWSGQGTVLLVDDEETLRALGARILEHLGLTVITAEDGRKALEIYRNDKDLIDAVLMDLTMPHMDGAQAYAEMRKINPDVKVVIASGNVVEDVAARFAGKGVAGILQKPYSIISLREVLSTILPSATENLDQK